VPFNIESHFHILLDYLLKHERKSFFETFDIDNESKLSEVIPNPNIQHVWKSAHILCRAFEAGLITIKGTQQ
jgi:hypothetical protein